MKFLVLALLAIPFCWPAVPAMTYWLEPCTDRTTGCETGDVQLAEWALQSWQRELPASRSFRRVEDASNARLQLYWATAARGLYGEMRPITVNGEPGAAVYVRPTLSGLGPGIEAAAQKDRLFRDTIVYLTCVHELGHAFGLRHTSDFADIMYSFQFGGDIPEYFGRFRRKLRTRSDFAAASALAEGDRKQLSRWRE